MALTRRAFICRSFASFGTAALAFERFGLLRSAGAGRNYKALVCIFLFGGNDSGNMLIPYDYATYAAVRRRHRARDAAVQSLAHQCPESWEPMCVPSQSKGPA